MPRIKLAFPEKALAQLSIPIRITDINYGNHVGNDSFVSLLHEARMQWLQHHGFTELAIDGVGLIMSELAIEFKGESFYGDQLDIAIACGEVTRVSFELFYRISTKRKEGDVLIAIAKTGMISYDYSAKKVSPLPASLMAILS